MPNPDHQSSPAPTSAPADEIDALNAAWERELPELVGLPLQLAKRLAYLRAPFDEATRVELGKLGLTYAEFDVLAALRRTGEPYRMRPSELTRSLMFTSGGISNVLQRMERAGLVAREADDADARSRWVKLTPDGVRQAEEALRANAAASDELLADVPEETLHAAVDVLRDLMRSVRQPRH